MRKRITSLLLALVMLVSLMPRLVVPAHAFWDDYDDGGFCPDCDHYHWAENVCDCQFCTIDCNYDCWVQTHCNDCGLCLGDTPYWCAECFKCADCMEETHCSTCAKCYIGEDDQLCGECHKGPCCSITICDSCGFCDDCANDDSDPMHCSLCNACFGAVDECVDDDDTGVIHCVDCHTACEQCEECLLAKESCEDCGLCMECCEINSEGGGCPDGETCVESAEWDEHICPGCDGWVTDKEDEDEDEDEDEFCETCELCKECCEGNSDCSEGMCAMDTDYADHFCDDCGLCFHDSDPCEDGCDQRCKDCCLNAVRAMGCEHDGWCFSDSDFEDHLKTEHSGTGHTHIASSSWSADGTQHWHPCRYCDEKMNPAGHEFDDKGVCKVCGYISGSSIVITRQPKGVKCKTSIYSSGDYDEEPENGLLFSEHNWVTFSVSAKSLKGDELTYQWYRKNNENPTAAPYKLPEDRFYTGVTTSTLKMPVSTQACQEDYSYYCVIGRKGDPSDTVQTADAKLTATHAYSYKQAGVPVPTDDSERTPKYNVTWVDKNGNTHDGVVGGNPKSDGHKLACLFEESALYEAHYMTTGSKERIFPHTFVLDRSLDAVGGGRVDVLRCSVCDYTVPVKSHVHDYGWNWDCTGFGSIYEYTFNIGGSTKTVEQLILESDYAHPEKCKIPGCEEFIMVPHSWGRWNVVKNPDTTGGEGGMEAECSVCEYKKTEIDGDWTKDTAILTVKNGRATRMIVKPGDKIKLYPEERTGQKAIGWKVEYLREYNDEPSVSKQWNYSQAKTLFKLVTNGSALEWGCTIPAFSAMGAPGGGRFFFEPVYEGCDHSGGTTVLNAKAQVCDRKGYTGDTACADCGQVISAGSDIYPPANAGHTGTLQPLYYYGTNPSATTDATHGGKRYNARSGDCRHRAYEGDYRCTACGGTVKGETGDFKHSGPFELRDVRAATCTEKGYSGNQYCTACDRIAQKGASTPSLHEIAGNYKLINAVKPTCTAVGYSGDYQCTGDCGQIFRYGHVIDKSGHDWDGGKPAKQGKSEGVLYTCRRVGCGETKFVKGSATTEYTVTVTNDGNGTGTASPSTAATGTEITLTATPNEGYRFKQWQVVSPAELVITNNKFLMPDSNVEVKAIFEEDAPPAPTDPAKPSISVTGTYTYDGSEKTANVTGYDPATMNITGNTGTDAGDYTVSVTSKTDKWADGSTDAVTAEWKIGKATQKAPTDLTGTAPTTVGGNDGKISGVTDKMEYRVAGESSYTACSGTEIENLSAGNYFVRYAEDNNHFASSDTVVTVGEGASLADCTITFNAGGGSGSMESVSVKAGTNYILPACGFIAPENQEFKAWEIGGTEYTVGDSYTVNEDIELKALWKDSVITPTAYTVTVSNDGNGAGTASSSTAAAGTEITLTATPNEGYHFKAWQVVSPTGLVIADNKFTMPDSDVEVRAIFEEDAPAPTEFIVTVTSGGNGTASASPAKAVAGTTITLTATPNAGYHFKKWQVMSGGVTITNNKFNMPSANVEVKAIFEKDAPPASTEFTITFDGNGGTPSGGSMTTTDQKLPSLPSASRSGSYSFDGWYAEKSGGTKITTDTVFSANTTVYAHWTYTGGGGGSSYSYYTIAATAGAGGSISPSGNVSVREGGDQTFTITPDKGYAVSTVKIDGKSIGAVKSYTFENVSRTHTIEVIFVKGTASASTGDSSNLPLWSALLLASTITLAGAVHYKRKRAR